MMSMLFNIDRFTLSSLQGLGAIIASTIFTSGVLLWCVFTIPSVHAVFVWCDWLAVGDWKVWLQPHWLHWA